MTNIISYFGEVKGELAKVVWPKRAEVLKLTLTIFAVSAIVGVYIGLLDLTFTKLIEKLLTL